MAHGKLGNASLTANTNTTVYTAPATCVRADVNIHISNQSGSAVAIAIAVTPTPLAVLAQEWIEAGTTLSMAGVYTNDSLKLSPGESIVVKSTVAGVTVRVQGSELTKIK